MIQELPNGDLLYPSRGPFPQEKKGYTRDLGDAYILHLDYLPCIHREKRIKITPCKKRIPFDYCVLKVIQVTPKVCQSCTERCEINE